MRLREGKKSVYAEDVHPRMSLQLKFAGLFFFTMLISFGICVFVLMILIRPILRENIDNEIISTVASMRQLDQINTKYPNTFSIEDMFSICADSSAEMTILRKKDSEYYRIKIDAAEQNVYIEQEGWLLPKATAYAVIEGRYIKFELNRWENFYWMAILVVLVTIGISIILGSLLTMFVSRRILKPISDLNAATNLVARGKFNVRVAESKEKEYAQLIKNFNRMAEELSGIETLRGDFISNVSHEFKTPLASIQGFAKLLQDDTITEEERSEYTQIIINETSRLSKLTSDILKLSKLENQKTIINKRRFSIDEQIRTILLVLEPEWNKKNIELDISLDTVYYYGNEDLMAQIWQNIINNAIKFTPENGHIGVRLFSNEKNITVRISDDGPSIPPETIERIFDKFYQGDNSRKTEGNGLGLALVKRIIDLCDGKMSVENLYDGGVCFVVELPYVIGDMM